MTQVTKADREDIDLLYRLSAMATSKAIHLTEDALALIARHREQAVQEAVAERDARIEGLIIERDFHRETADLHAARIAALEAWRRGILEWLAHECGISPDDLPNHLALQEIDNVG